MQLPVLTHSAFVVWSNSLCMALSWKVIDKTDYLQLFLMIFHWQLKPTLRFLVNLP